jgi:cytosine/adenosine deaminase-related metal-dependent hydrolase
MSVIIKAQYEKINATFSLATEAYADKQSLYSTELYDQVENCYREMLSQGILVSPVYPEWDPILFTLDVCKPATSLEAYQAAQTYSSPAVIQASVDAGWTYLGYIVVPA